MTPREHLAEIIRKIETYAPDADISLIERAFAVSSRCHEGQFRDSGEPYIIHPLAVAELLADMKLDIESIAVGLLHDVIEDSLITHRELQEAFSPQIADMVEGLSKIARIKFTNREEATAENFRKLVIAMSEDPRVILVKLADRTHNMRTLDFVGPERQRRIAQETLDIYAPIANRIGIQSIKIELEEQSFRYLHPEYYRQIEERLEERRDDYERYMTTVRLMLTELLKDEGIEATVDARVKHIYSIFRKMVNKKVEFDQIQDLIAFRILVDSIATCYHALGLVHSRFNPVDHRFKDYIARPKANGYQSLHTTVVGPDGQQCEIQIRTHEMHRVAESGIAAHWRYKEGRLELKENDFNRISTLRSLCESARDNKDASDFMDSIRHDLFADEIYALTPRGDVKRLPEGATPLDFAFAIHTEIGLHCSGAQVDGRIVPFSYQLKNGELVKVFTSASARPSRDWLAMVKTSKARNKIRAFLRQEERARAGEIGKTILEQEFRRHDLNLNRMLKDDRFQEALAQLKLRTPEELFAAIGLGTLGPKDVLKELLPEEKLKSEKRGDGILGRMTRILKPRKSASPVLIRGESDILVTFAQCCKPLRGDPIVGLSSPVRGIVVHQRDCTNVQSADPERRIEAEWDESYKAPGHAKIRVICANRPGLLASMSKTISTAGVNISNAQCHASADGTAVNVFDVVVADRETLLKVLVSLESIRGVISALRVRD